MAAPSGVADSYTTAMNVALVKNAAAGVLANDTGTGTITAVYVADSAAGGTVSLASDGSFTFTPTANFVGTASFRYKAHNDDGDSAEITVSVTVGDAVQWAHLLMGSEGGTGVEGDGRGRARWQAFADLRNRTPHEIAASPKLPQKGDPLKRYKLEAGAYAITRSYEADGGTVNENVVVVLVEAKQDESNPRLWHVTVHYEGKDDPTAELPEMQEQETEYIDYRTEDIHGLPVTNSALDPVEGGMPFDAAWDSVVVTRNVPFGAWNTTMKAGLRNTLNLKPYVLGNQVDGLGNPVVLPPGTVRLKRITAQRVTRAKAATVAAAKFYWRITFELLIDDRVYRPSGGAAEEKVRHRFVYADAGFNTLSAGVRTPIKFVGMTNPTEPQLLDGAGGLLANPKNSPPPSTVPFDGPGLCAAANRAYAYPASGPLTKAAGELHADCYTPGGAITAHLVTNVTAAMGSLTLGSDGSFTFTRNASPLFVGYAWFTYRVKAGGVDATYSAPATVLIFCGAVPVMNARERYRMKDWSALSAILEDW
jgi:hypothetical protein